MRDDFLLAGLAASRICHDLVGPLGAIGNGVELLVLAGGRGEEMDLISESVASATARLRFFHVAYGQAGAGQQISRAEVVQTLTAVSRGGRLSFLWSVDDDQPRDEVRAVFLALQCIEAAMPRGGEVQVVRIGRQWVITGDSMRINADADLWTMLESGAPMRDISPAQIQFALLPRALGLLGRRAGVTIMPERITLRF